jgi:hypothetical protein
MTKNVPTVSLKRALEGLRRNAVLIRENGGERRFFVVPLGEVDEETARAICDRPDVVGGRDSLFPGLDQTWRMLR